MQGVLSGFAVIAIVIGVGYVLGRGGHLGVNGREVLTKLAFHVASPALLFTTLARADLAVIFSSRLLVTALSTAAAAGAFVAVGVVVRGWGVGRTTIGVVVLPGDQSAGNSAVSIVRSNGSGSSMGSPNLTARRTR